MTDMAELLPFANIEASFRRGIAAFGIPAPMSLSEWATKHFYLSAESSYVEGAWRAWPYQRGLMALMSHDDVRELDLRKSARVGYTKMILACVGYMAHHRRRNQALWQPTDDDAVEFVKTELDPMLRDVPSMLDVFPAFLRRDKDNTLAQKKFLGSLLHVRGGKAAKNYRRISVDTAYLDELDAFDSDVEREGSPIKLAAKRIEGATFPKLILGTTPKLRGFSLIEAREALADIHLRYAIPCPECGGFHPLTFGGADETHGLKWHDRDSATVRHLCPHCHCLIDQGQYLAAAHNGRWQSQDGAQWMDDDANFFDAAGPLPTPNHVAAHLWTAYSPSVAWPAIVREFLDAAEKQKQGRNEDIKTFRNTTLGETYAEEVDATDADALRARAEPLPLGRVPKDCLLLVAGVDTQDAWLEATVWGFGRGSQMWTIDHIIIHGNTIEPEPWEALERYIVDSEFDNDFGQKLRIECTAVDTGGHSTQAAYYFCQTRARYRIHAIKGYSARETRIKQGMDLVDLNWRGKRLSSGLKLWTVGTNMAKDLLYGRLHVTRPGPGYVHVSAELSTEWYAQFTSEARYTKKTATGEMSRWDGTRRRREAWDCAVYAIWCEHYLDLKHWSQCKWATREERYQPANGDLFAQPAPAAAPAQGTGQPDAPAAAATVLTAQPPASPATPPPLAPARPRSGAGSDEWRSRL